MWALLMDIHHVRAFLAVAESGSVTKAASQPGVTQQLHTFERFVGARLLRRESGQMVLTHHGAHVLPYARMLILLADEMCREPLLPRPREARADLP